MARAISSYSRCSELLGAADAVVQDQPHVDRPHSASPLGSALSLGEIGAVPTARSSMHGDVGCNCNDIYLRSAGVAEAPVLLAAPDAGVEDLANRPWN